jgi:hypothetical protein
MPSADGKKITRNCFVCEKTISSALTGKLRHEFCEPPESATCWTTRGSYGSRMFDADVGNLNEELEICICDDCLEKKQALVYRFVVEKRTVAVARF